MATALCVDWKLPPRVANHRMQLWGTSNSGFQTENEDFSGSGLLARPIQGWKLDTAHWSPRYALKIQVEQLGWHQLCFATCGQMVCWPVGGFLVVGCLVGGLVGWRTIVEKESLHHSSEHG